MSADAPAIGVFGGSFDPIHIAHLRTAEEIAEAFRLDRVLFVPAANPPHKQPTTDARVRFRMVELAIAGNPRFAASSLEIDRDGPSYSVETLRELRRREPRAVLTFLLGEDAFREIHTWHDCPSVFGLANVVVVNRPPNTLDPSIAHLPVAAQNAFCYDPPTREYRHQTGTRLCFHTITGFDLSATAIRRATREGRSIRYLVASDVERFIVEHGLYR